MVKWHEIEAECGGYREGFVAVFRRYEGQPTDEKDGAGRIVKVTAASFARHVGIPRQTFEEWVKRDGAGRRLHRDRTLESIRREATDRGEELVQEIAKTNPDAIRKVALQQGLASSDEPTVDDVWKEARPQVQAMSEGHRQREAVIKAIQTLSNVYEEQPASTVINQVARFGGLDTFLMQVADAKRYTDDLRRAGLEKLEKVR